MGDKYFEQRINMSFLFKLEKKNNQVIIGDECWVFQYDPEIKRQSMQWKSPGSPRPKKARMSKSKFIKMLIFSLIARDSAPRVYLTWSDCQPEVLSPSFGTSEIAGSLCEARIFRRQVHHDNAPSHKVLSVKEFLAKKLIVVLEQPAYSPDVAPPVFFHFPTYHEESSQGITF
jgi:hypothetical protein